ncbi:MAG: N-acetylmuramoyl-L-alanine amidase [Candidatus Tectomicrobia bacterium]|uniref:N-acetylmuramoyl-L-alanine amidase n=1 Tax=Tectimicrobiota bacterium TaxID=2528274 RepID=A0A932MN89_UNCTE|nr:N-acetylmuramoyl-L-alanine amidase [Candidatus Tectomicrobia bacterium]
MRLLDHWLEGEGVVRRATPNAGGALAPRFLVFHYTAGRDAESAAEWLCTPAARASAHAVVARDGRIFQLAPFSVRAWHAGESRWGELTGLNAWSIGIEMDNPGRLARSQDGFRTWFRAPVPAEEALRARHKNEAQESWWHRYTEAQIARAVELARLLAGAYGIEEVLGHDDIAPGRKADPGPAFPLAEVRARALAREKAAP